ncbi:MAG: alpha/beta hydrolase [Haloechinothrix sp.]
MTRTAERLGAGRYIEAGTEPAATRTTLYQLSTSDGATVPGVLRTIPGATTVVCIMHPRQDQTHHPLVSLLLHAGFAVWTQFSRSVNNDLNLIHEQALLDVAAGQAFLRQHGFDDVVVLGHSGGGTLFAFYLQQGALKPAERLSAAPSGRPVDLPGAEMPLPSAAVFLAPHPGQGALLMNCIDPSIADETDRLSVIEELDPFNPDNGFRPDPESSRYTAEFLTRYRAAQRARMARIDEKALGYTEQANAARRRFRETGSAADRRTSLAPRIITVYRTDADPRTVDLSLDPNDRPYGSLFGRRPDLINYGLVGFGRLTTPDAWLSTWSGLRTNADFVRCAPGVTVPTQFIELTGDQAAFPTDSARMFNALGTADKTYERVRGLHFGGAIRPDEPTGNTVAADRISAWLGDRFEAAPTP